jgi:AraC-like DNA-binding protein
MTKKSSAQTVRLQARGAYPVEVDRRLLAGDFGMHTHDHVELFIVLNGSAVHTVGERRYFIKAGDVYVLREGVEHAFTNVSSLVHYNIGFDPRLLTALGDEISRIEGFQRLFMLAPSRGSGFLAKQGLSRADLQRAETLAEAVRTECREHGPGYEVVARARLIELVVFLSRRYVQQSSQEVDGLLRLARAAAHVEACYREAISVGDLAALAGLSPSHFGRLFRRHYRASPAAYAQSLRIQHAAFMLSDSDTAVGRIGLECGFSDSNYFARQFRRRMGCTPREYRRQHRSGDAGEDVQVVG